jgi:hypothetical protein
VSIGRIDVTVTLARVEQLLAGDPSISPAVRAMMELLVTIITLMMEKLGLNSSQQRHRSIERSRPPARSQTQNENDDSQAGRAEGTSGKHTAMDG